MSEQERGEHRDPMRVAVFVRRWGGGGGSERNAVELARHLDRRGHEVQVYCQKVDPAVDFDVPVIHRLRGASFDPSLAMLAFARASDRQVRRMRSAGDPAVVIGFDHGTLHDVYRLGRGLHAEYLARCAVDPALPPGGPVVDRVALMLERRRFRAGRFDALIAVSDKVAADAVRHYPAAEGRVVVVRNGVDQARFSSTGDPDERAQVRRRWGVGDDEPVLLLVGRNPALKGLPAAEAVAAQVRARIVYVGERPRSGATSKAIWDGPRDDVPSCYRAADVVIQPSRYEAFGNVPLEAIACGTPVVARGDMGSTELFAGTPLGQLTVDDPGDVPGLVAAVRRALDPAVAPELRRAGLELAAGSTRARWAIEVEAVLLGARGRRAAG